jgi:hypothetical protein
MFNKEVFPLAKRRLDGEEEKPRHTQEGAVTTTRSN